MPRAELSQTISVGAGVCYPYFPASVLIIQSVSYWKLPLDERSHFIQDRVPFPGSALLQWLIDAQYKGPAPWYDLGQL